jgi:AcrR family transcriptional regulator
VPLTEPRTTRTTGAVPGATDVRILDAAEQAVRRLGLRRVSMGDVARLAGVSRGSVYRYFPDRETLVASVLTRAAERFVRSSEEVVRRRRTLAAQVAEAAVYIRQHLHDERVTLAPLDPRDTMLAALLTSHLDDLVESWVQFWQPLLVDARERGEIRPELEPRQAAEWIVRMMLSFAVMPSVVIDLDDPIAVRRFVQDHIVRGLA